MFSPIYCCFCVVICTICASFFCAIGYLPIQELSETSKQLAELTGAKDVAPDWGDDEEEDRRTNHVNFYLFIYFFPIYATFPFSYFSIF